ncbi:MAG: aminopeptidase P family protein [Acidobacteria bacterium]|nr:aminopeptidase P family protein [Acidobacteriota bacterium]
MAFDLSAIQRALREDGLDGWLLYDFHGSNPIARRVTGLGGSGKLTTRRWYYLVPASGEPRALVHGIERHSLAHLPGSRRIYAGRNELEAGLDSLVQGMRRIAMEYSPNCAIPYVSRVDAGTVERIRSLGADVVSSGDLVQRFEAVWDDGALASHRTASRHLHSIKDRTFELIADRVGGGSLTEYAVQQVMTEWFADAGLLTDCPPVVAAQESSGNPHYLPTAEAHRPIGRGQVVLLDLWGKIDKPGAVYADITWVGFTGSQVPPRAAAIFGAAREARDAAVSLVAERVHAGRPISGWEVDRAARDVIDAAGYGDRFMHRTGHSLGEEVHGNGVHMDDYETHDERRLIAGTGFTIEPGVYLDDFGVRTEINVYVDAADAAVTGPRQAEIVPLA